MMGNQNTSVYNKTTGDIIAILTDNETRNTQVLLKSGDVKYIPTTKGRVTISCFDDIADKKNSVIYTDESNRGFIIDKEGDHLVILRASREDPKISNENPRYFEWKGYFFKK
jgi:hypothetical protein